MEQIPVESRTALDSLLRVIGGTRTRFMSTKDTGTLRSRQSHFLKFLTDMKLDANVALQGFTQLVRNIIMACYTAHLASGQTLLYRAIKTETIKKYLKAATDLSLPFQMMNPALNLLGNQSKYIGDILHEASRWESMPNRREPLTKDMVVYILDKGSAMESADNLYTVMGDWLTLGLQTGARRQEWAQDRTSLERRNHVDLNVDGSPTAFIESDFEFRGFNGLRLSTDSLPSLDLIATVRITWRYRTWTMVRSSRMPKTPPSQNFVPLTRHIKLYLVHTASV